MHTDELFAREVAGYPTVFAHGMLTMGMTGRMLTNYVGDGRLTKYAARFTSQVWPGDTLDATATVTAVGDNLVELVVSTVNQAGVEVLNGRPGRVSTDLPLLERRSDIQLERPGIRQLTVEKLVGVNDALNADHAGLSKTFGVLRPPPALSSRRRWVRR